MNNKTNKQAVKAIKSRFIPCYRPTTTRKHTVDIPGAPPLTLSSDTPDYIAAVLNLDVHTVSGDFSVTELLQPPRCVLVKREHPELKEQKPGSRVSCTSGKALHHYFAEHLSDDFTAEELHCSEIPGLNAKLSGTIDAYRLSEDGSCLILDLKHQKPWVWVNRKFENVVWQLNMYYYLLSRKHPEIIGKTKLSAQFLFTDYNRIEAGGNRDRYPPEQAMNFTTESMEIEQIEAFIKKRLGRLLELREKAEEEWPDPSPEEVFQSGAIFKVFREGGQRATKTFRSEDYDSSEGARAAAEKKMVELQEKNGGEYGIREAWADRLRCSTYCEVASECSTYQTWLKGDKQGESAPVQDVLEKAFEANFSALIPSASPQDVERGEVSLDDFLKSRK
ncbi:hypothetical protein HN911_00465 [Candidatus Bathyarchaeota archaeon]|jgi:hypothetical protein|nr:hypothetical protein [Candidatus Bathyarchaeota archaeon]